MKRKFFYSMMVLILMSIFSLNSFATNKIATPKNSVLILNGKEVEFVSYNIDGYNFMKLRDLAFLLNNTSKQFNLGWDQNARGFFIISGESYKANGTEMKFAKPGKRPARENIHDVVITDDAETERIFRMIKYDIDNYNYVKLADMGILLDMLVDWNGKNVVIDTNQKSKTRTTLPKFSENTPDVFSEIPIEENASNFKPVDAKKLANLKSIKQKLTDKEFNQAYQIALNISKKYAGLSTEEQLVGIYQELRKISEEEISYSMEAKNYSNPYGFFVSKSASCAGSTRATGLCLNILGIPYEHINENQFSHQWCRVKVGNKYWICDPFGMYVGEEPGQRQHPLLGF